MEALVGTTQGVDYLPLSRVGAKEASTLSTHRARKAYTLPGKVDNTSCYYIHPDRPKEPAPGSFEHESSMGKQLRSLHPSHTGPSSAKIGVTAMARPTISIQTCPTRPDRVLTMRYPRMCTEMCRRAGSTHFMERWTR